MVEHISFLKRSVTCEFSYNMHIQLIVYYDFIQVKKIVRNYNRHTTQMLIKSTDNIYNSYEHHDNIFYINSSYKQ